MGTSLHYLRRVLADVYYIFARKQIQEIVDYERYWDANDGIVSGEIYYCYILEKVKIIRKIAEDGSSVLDIGCGNGDFLYNLMKNVNIEGFGVDISETGVSQPREKGIIGEIGDLTDPRYNLKGWYDYITILGVLEHMQVPEVIMEKVK